MNKNLDPGKVLTSKIVRTIRPWKMLTNKGARVRKPRGILRKPKKQIEIVYINMDFSN
jgi:hypothetical protein